MTPQDSFQQQLEQAGLVESLFHDPEQVPVLVDLILNTARQHEASDIHLIPRESVLEMNWRINGVLHLIAQFPHALKSNIVTRLKVLADLLTYHSEIPQEGRIQSGEESFEMRVSTFPSLFGEKAVIRLFVGSGNYRTLESLSFSEDISTQIKQSLFETSGVMLVTGPAGSGKTTTAYACLREIVEDSPVRRSISTLEDPIEAVIPAASQSQIRPQRGFDYSVALKSLLRQDPEVIMVGEIRDVETAQLVFQAALTGHLVLTTFHAGSASEAVSRLLDMGIEPYQLTSGLLCILNQQLTRNLCGCAQEGVGDQYRLGLSVDHFRIPVGCNQCDGTGYQGRSPILEMLTLDTAQTREAVLAKQDSKHIEAAAMREGMISREQVANAAVESGRTSPAEVRRVLGFRHSSDV